MGDDGDAASDHAHEEITSQLLEIEVRELEQIERALKRFAEGVYGRCEVCGRRIGEARINALPYVTHCIDCQREAERLGGSRRRQEDVSRWAQLYETEARSREPEVNLSDYETDPNEPSYR
jgi:RNA polymerase-binding transcription factor DksA